MKKKGFTLIELIAVLVIMAIIALIVTPLILNIINKTKDSANKRSVDAYGRSVELSIATYLLDNGKYPSSIDELTIEYSGNEVECKTKQINEDGSIYLTECSVDKKEVKDNSTEDGYYHYGKDISKYDYKIGDKITYNGMEFYVIADSDETSDNVTMLKSEPLTLEEVNTYGAGHINKYTQGSKGTTDNNNGYGGLAYYSSETCGYINGSYVKTGCTTNYDESDIKYVVDAWATDKFKVNDLIEDNLGYKARLITYEELYNNLGYNQATKGPSWLDVNSEYTPEWVYNYNYWTMSLYKDAAYEVWFVVYYGILNGNYVSDLAGISSHGLVRPVVTLSKSTIN